MKKIFFLGSLLSILTGCHQDIQPTSSSIPTASSKVADGSAITGTPKIAQAMIDSMGHSIGQLPTGFSVTAVKLDIDKLVTMTARNDSMGVGKASAVVYTDTVWKETSTKLSTTTGLNQPFKLTDVPSGTYRVVLIGIGSQFTKTINKVKVLENATTDLGIINI
ncbi:hypothetical protein [Spirosoma litoris]